MAQILTHTWSCTAFRTGNRTRLNPTNWHSRARHFVGLWVGERREGTGGGGAKAWRKSKQQQEGCQEWQSTKEDGRCQSKQQELRVPFSRSVSPQNIKVQHLSAICKACWKESRKQKNGCKSWRCASNNSIICFKPYCWILLLLHIHKERVIVVTKITILQSIKHKPRLDFLPKC